MREYQAEAAHLAFSIKSEKASHIATREFDSGQVNLNLDGKPGGKIAIRNGVGEFDVPAGVHMVQVGR